MGWYVDFLTNWQRIQIKSNLIWGGGYGVVSGSFEKFDKESKSEKKYLFSGGGEGKGGGGG